MFGEMDKADLHELKNERIRRDAECYRSYVKTKEKQLDFTDREIALAFDNAIEAYGDQSQCWGISLDHAKIYIEQLIILREMRDDSEEKENY